MFDQGRACVYKIDIPAWLEDWEVGGKGASHEIFFVSGSGKFEWEAGLRGFSILVFWFLE